MDGNVLVTKISATPTDHAWSQAYSTLNLYIVLSIKTENEEGLLNAGKELFEKIQREYFSLDEKDLKSIKGSVQAAIGEFSPEKKIFLILATVRDNILYIVTAGTSAAVIKRGDKVGSIAKGEDEQVIAFSGELKNDDIVILETSDFAAKIPIDKLSEVLKSRELSEISESLAPSIHEDSIGTEAALILKYKNIQEEAGFSEEAVEENLTRSEEKEDLPEKEGEEDIKENTDFPPQTQLKTKRSLPKIPFSLAALGSIGRKKMIIVAIVILAIILSGSIYFESQRQENARANTALEEILTPAEEKFGEATSLLSLNQALALEEFEEIKGNLEEKRSQFKEGSTQLARLDEFIGKVESEIGKISDGATITNQKEIATADFAVFRNGNLITVTSGGVVNIINNDGESKDEFETENENVKAITASDTSIYILGDSGITRTTISSGATEDAVEEADDLIAIDLFGTNVYGLNSDTKSVDRFSGTNFTQGNYLEEDTELDNPVSMTIDGSIWVMDSGKVRKFTRGAEDSFEVTGLSISDNVLIFTSTDYANLYLVDKNASKVYVISKNGDIENQYSASFLSDATSVSADEESDTIYVTSGGKLYSFVTE